MDVKTDSKTFVFKGFFLGCIVFELIFILFYILKNITGLNFEARTLQFFAFGSLFVPLQFLVVHFSNI